jgi:hypothetical protein
VATHGQTTVDPGADVRSPDELDIAADLERIAAYSEDWVSSPRRANCGERLGPASQKQAVALLERGIDEAAIRQAALDALAFEEQKILRRHRLVGWAVFALCIAIGILAALSWNGRGDNQGSFQILLLGAFGLMLAHSVHVHGQRKRSRLIRSSAARKQVWRTAIQQLSDNHE